MESFHSDLAVVKSEVMQMRTEIQRLTNILIESPDKSLIARMAISETKISVHDSMLQDILENAWQLKLALLTSLLGFLGSAGVVCFEVFLKGK